MMRTRFPRERLFEARTWRGLARVVRVAVLCAVAFATYRPRRAPAARVAVRVAVRVECRTPAGCALAEALALDVWTERRGPGLPLDVVVASDALPVLTAAGERWSVLVPDIDADARSEAARLRATRRSGAQGWFDEYRDFDEISEHLAELARGAPERAVLQTLGPSVEGRPLWALRVGRGPTPVLITGTQHAREWIATMVSTCVASRLVTDYERDPAVRAFVDGTTTWLVPVVNPDGYLHSWSTDRYWRKNRRGGYGVDLNRNFDLAWGGEGSSGDERSQTYRGPRPFSEPESAAVRDLALRERVALHVDFHSYGQLVLYPWGYTTSPAPERDRLRAVGDRMASAIFAQHETPYQLMSGAELYPAAGTMSDWLHAELATASYTIELRPRGRPGFVLPPGQIRPTCDEGLAAVLALRAAMP